MKYVETALLRQPWEVIQDIQRLRDLALSFDTHVSAMLKSFSTRGLCLPRYQAFVTDAAPKFLEARAIAERHWQAIDLPIDVLCRARRWSTLKCPRRRANIIVMFVQCLMAMLTNVQFPHLLELIAMEA